MPSQTQKSTEDTSSIDQNTSFMFSQQNVRPEHEYLQKFVHWLFTSGLFPALPCLEVQIHIVKKLQLKWKGQDNGFPQQGLENIFSKEQDGKYLRFGGQYSLEWQI